MPDVSQNLESAHTAPIFILGSGRSGTTLMRFMLNAHPDIYISEEVCYHFWLRNSQGDFRKRLYAFFHSFSYAWLRMDPRVVLDGLPKNFDQQHAAQIYLRVLQCKAGQYGKTRYGEKGPLLIEDLDQLLQEYPQARIIHMMRDPRAVVYSHYTMPWSTSSFIGANLMVHHNMRTLQRYQDRLLTVKLEDLLAAPEAQLRRILDYIGVPWSEQVLHHTDHLPENDGIPFPWLMEASRRPQQKKLSWREGIPPVWIHLTQRWNRDTFQRYGYEPLPLASPPSLLQQAAAILMDLPSLLMTGLRYVRMVAGFLLIPKTRTATYQTLLHSLNPAAWQRQGWSPELPEPPAVNVPDELLKK
ncbi:MAG: sulfotransferase [Sterolibacterium sp.]|nr:sulfotransferase [Sterolibacterium sp.]